MEKAFKNWRVAVLAALGVIATVLITSEEENGTTGFIVKAAGFALAYAVYRLFRHWQKRGKLEELMSIVDSEE